MKNILELNEALFLKEETYPVFSENGCDPPFLIPRIIKTEELEITVERRHLSSFEKVKEYFKNRYPKFYRKAQPVFKIFFTFILPAILAVLLASAINENSKYVKAVEVSLDGKYVGYVKSEAELKQAKDTLASFPYTKISLNASKEKIIKVQKLLTAEGLKKEIKSQEERYVNALSVYIDGKFFCTAKSKKDADEALHSLLIPFEKKAGKNDTVEFFEEVNFFDCTCPKDSKSILTKKEIREKAKDLLKVKTTSQKKETFPIIYEKTVRKTTKLFEDERKIIQKGENGKAVKTNLLIFKNGKLYDTKTISEEIILKPKAEITLIGTKPRKRELSFIWPSKDAKKISSPFGYREKEISGNAFHGGIDIIDGTKSSIGLSVIAASSGVVTAVEKGYSGYGHMVLISHSNSIKTRYAHMLPGSISVKVGDKILKGQQIGKIGSTGNTTGPHLHFEIIENGVKKNPLDYIK